MKEADFAGMWFEDLGLGRRARYRRWLHAYFEVLKSSVQNVDAVLTAAGALSGKESEQLALLPSLRQDCALVACSLRALLEVKRPEEVAPVVDVLLEKRQQVKQRMAMEFPRCHEVFVPPSLVFCLAVSGVLQDTCDALASLSLYGVEERKSCVARVCRYIRSLQGHVEIKLYERTITHPRFVLRYSLTLTLTFLLGWLGVANVIAPYSSGPASTVSVIIYTFTGASLPLTLRRFNGVLLGKILGSVAQRLLAVRTLGHAICFGLFQLFSVMALVFLSWHSKKHGGVGLLTAAYAMSELIPENGLFRDPATRLTSQEGSFLFVTMVGTFLGVAVLLVVDLILASSAKRQAKQRLLRGIRRVSKFVGQVLDPSDDPLAPIDPEQPEREEYLEKLQAKIYEDLSLSPTCQAFHSRIWLFWLVSSGFKPVSRPKT